MKQIYKLLIYICAVLTVSSFFAAYFIKPHTQYTERVLVTSPAVTATRSSELAERLSKFYHIALVLTSSDFSEKNATALESLRSWATQQFAKDSNFLHPASLKLRTESTQSIIDSLGYNLFALPRLALEDVIAACLTKRIQDFQNTGAYLSLKNDYFGLFGNDAEAQMLLARYQAVRAENAISAIMTFLWWSLLALIGVFWFRQQKRKGNDRRWQDLWSCVWLALGLFYIFSAWSRDEVSVLIAAIVCGGIGLYIKYPVKVIYGPDQGLHLGLTQFSTKTLAAISWFTISLIFIRILTWIKTGSIIEPDPITLLICSITGNFLHDPAHIKANIDKLIGVLWLVLSFWTVIKLRTEDLPDTDQQEAISALKLREELPSR